MFIDSTLSFAEEADISNSTPGFTLIGSAVDVRPVGITDNTLADLSGGEPIYVVIEVTTSFASTNITEYELALFTHTANTGVTGGEMLWNIRLLTQRFAAGQRFVFQLPVPLEGQDNYERYLGIGGRKTGTTTSGTASGQITAYMTKDVSNWSGTATRVPATDPAN